MNQATFDLPTLPHVHALDPVDRTGFEIGWDHAHHGLVPPAELLLDGTPLGQGWRAGKAVYGRRTLGSSRHVRAWLALRIRAWREGVAFEGLQVTPHYLSQLHVTHCPVTRAPLGGAPCEADAAVIERVNPQAGYAAGNLVVMSYGAARARAGLTVIELLRRAQRAAAGEVQALDAAAWTRLAALQACATPLPFHEAARLPLAVLPPNRVRVLNAAQGLQALLTLQFTRPGWSARTRAFAALLPEHTVRHDFHLFIGALAPRVIEAEQTPAGLRTALEDAWLQDRVQRRWQHLVLSLGEAATEALLERAAAQGLAGVRTVTHAPEQATEGWALQAGGRQAPQIHVPLQAGWRPLPVQRPASPATSQANSA